MIQISNTVPFAILVDGIPATVLMRREILGLLEDEEDEEDETHNDHRTVRIRRTQ